MILLSAKGGPRLPELVRFSGFSFNRKERAIIEGVESHLGIVKKTIDDFEGLIDSVAKGDVNAARRFFEEVMNDETKADTIHRDLSLRVANGAFFGGVREDILALLEKIDNIADSAKDASRFLNVEVGMNGSALRLLKSEEMHLFISDLKNAVLALEKLIAAFTISKNEVLSRVHSVEEFEESADSRKDLILGELFRASAKINPVTVIQLRDFIFIADDIADNAEDASDVVLVLIAKGYG